MGRKVARESTMKLLYQMDSNEDFSQEAIDIFFENHELKTDEVEYLNLVTKGIKDNLEEIDSFIEQYSEGWKIKRIAKIDLAILRIALYEIIHIEEMPPQVSINEAVEVAKEYGTDESSKYINGLLGTFMKKHPEYNSENLEDSKDN